MNDHDCPRLAARHGSDNLAGKTTWTVLCVDDDPNVSEALARRFVRRGIRVLRAFCGMQGYWLAVTAQPDAIILDVDMPKGNGAEILECLKRNPQTAEIPVIVLTGKTAPDLSGKMRNLGANRFFNKPAPFDDLIHEIRRSIPAEG